MRVRLLHGGKKGRLRRTRSSFNSSVMRIPLQGYRHSSRGVIKNGDLFLLKIAKLVSG